MIRIHSQLKWIESRGFDMLTCKEAEKMIMPYIAYQLDEEELELFLNHIEGCKSCQDELEIYYTVAYGLRQLDEETGVYDIAKSLRDSLTIAWKKIRHRYLRKVIYYAVHTLCVTSIFVTLFLQFRIWIQNGF